MLVCSRWLGLLVPTLSVLPHPVTTHNPLVAMFNIVCYGTRYGRVQCTISFHTGTMYHVPCTITYGVDCGLLEVLYRYSHPIDISIYWSSEKESILFAKAKILFCHSSFVVNCKLFQFTLILQIFCVMSAQEHIKCYNNSQRGWKLWEMVANNMEQFYPKTPS